MIATLDLSPNTLAPGQVAAIPLALIDPDPDNERGADAYLPELLGDLRTSLAAQGQVEPIQVYALPDGRYMNRTGHRRCAAARDLGWETIQALIVPTPADVVERSLSRIVSNLQRTDPDPIKLAISCQAILDAGTNQAALAKRMGHTQPWIANLLRLLALPAEAQALISAGKLTAAHGLELLRCDLDELNYDGQPTGKTAATVQAGLATEAVTQDYSTKQLREEVNRYRSNQQTRLRWAEQRRQEAAERAANPDRTTEAERRRAAQDAKWAAERAAMERRREVAEATIRAKTAFDPQAGPTLAHLKAAAGFLASTAFSYRNELPEAGDRKSFFHRIEKARDIPAVLALMGTLVQGQLLGNLDYTGAGFTSPTEWSAACFNLKPEIADAQRAAGLAPTPAGDAAA